MAPVAQSIAAGPDGNEWFTIVAAAPPGIGRITPGGQVTEFTAGMNRGSDPDSIAPGPDGNMWFTDIGPTPAIGLITPTGQITEYPLPTSNYPGSIAEGPDGNMWFTQPDEIGRITTSGQITEFPLSAGGTYAGAIAPGPDGYMWFTVLGAQLGYQVERISMDGQVIDTYSGLGYGLSIAPGADGNMWMVGALPDDAATLIYQLGTNSSPASLSPPAVVGVTQAGSSELCIGDRWAVWAGQAPVQNASTWAVPGVQWLRDGVPIAGATGQTYTASTADAGHQLACRVAVTYPLLQVGATATSAPVTITPATGSTTEQSGTLTITHLTQSHRSWREGTKLAVIAAGRAPIGTTYAFVISRRARVTLAFTRWSKGRKTKRGCLRQTHPRTTGSACSYGRRVGTLAFTAHARRNDVRFYGRLPRSKSLATGRYTLTVTARTGPAHAAAHRNLGFTIVR
jgi:streptogramin lyase